MERKVLENKVKELISMVNIPQFTALLENSISSFSDNDLQKILKFIETWDKELITNFLQEKTKDFMWEVQAIKFAKWKIKIWKNSRIEKAERIEEEKELEILLSQLD